MIFSFLGSDKNLELNFMFPSACNYISAWLKIDVFRAEKSCLWMLTGVNWIKKSFLVRLYIGAYVVDVNTRNPLASYIDIPFVCRVEQTLLLSRTRLFEGDKRQITKFPIELRLDLDLSENNLRVKWKALLKWNNFTSRNWKTICGVSWLSASINIVLSAGFNGNIFGLEHNGLILHWIRV